MSGRLVQGMEGSYGNRTADQLVEPWTMYLLLAHCVNVNGNCIVDAPSCGVQAPDSYFYEEKITPQSQMPEFNSQQTLPLHLFDSQLMSEVCTEL